MSRYFMHIFNSIGFVQDEEGREFDTFDQVRAEAIKGIRSLVSAEALRGCIDLRGRMEIADAEGRVVLTLSFEEVVHMKTGSLPTVVARGRDL